MKMPYITTNEGLKPVTSLPDDELVQGYLSACSGAAGSDLVQLLCYAINNGGAKKAGAVLRCCLEGVGRLVAIYPGLGQTPPAGSECVGGLIDGGLYFVPVAKYREIRNKTPFDFCNDTGLLLAVTECASKCEFEEGLTAIERGRALFDLAERTNDRALMAAVGWAFADELTAYLATFNE